MAKIVKGREPKIEKEIDKDKALLDALSGLSKDFKSTKDLLEAINNNQIKGTKAYDKLHDKLVKEVFQTINTTGLKLSVFDISSTGGTDPISI